MKDRRSPKQRIQLAEEEVAARRKFVDAGAARVTKTAVKTPARLHVPLLRERVIVVEETLLPRIPAQSEFVARSIRMPLHGENARLERRVVEVEEVTVGKEYQQSVARIPYTQRREELAVEETENHEVST